MACQRGFTLLEVLVALTLTGLLVATLFAGFRVGIDSWDTADRHVQRTEDSRQLVNFLSRHLSQIQPVIVMNDELFPEPALMGTASSLRYVAPLSLSTGNQPYLFELVSGYRGEPGVWVRFAPYHSSESGQVQIGAILAGAEFLQVSEGFGLEFEYFVAQEETEGWAPEFQGGQLKLVAVQVVDEQGRWPRLTMAVSTGPSMVQ